MEGEVAKVHGADYVGLTRLTLQNVSLKRLNARLSGNRQGRQVVLGAVVQRLWVDIKSDGALIVIKLHPLAAQGKGTAEILAQDLRLLFANVSIDKSKKPSILFGGLHGLSIRGVLIKRPGGRSFHIDPMSSRYSANYHHDLFPDV
jgi:hypothetical protein